MAPRIQPVYYRAKNGVQPVDRFIDTLPDKHQEAIDNQIDRIGAICTLALPDLPFPYSSQIEGQLRELRCHYGRYHYRVLYRRSRNLVILLHAFQKTTKNVPPAEIKIAQERWDDFRNRMDETPRRRPRAAGRDAP